MYEVILRDLRDRESSEPESSLGLFMSVEKAYDFLHEYLKFSGHGNYVTYYRIINTDDNTVIDEQERLV